MTAFMLVMSLVISTLAWAKVKTVEKELQELQFDIIKLRSKQK